MAEALARPPAATRTTIGRDDETLRRIGSFVELHVEQGRGAGRPRPPRRGRQRHLAARPLAARLHRRGQPRRHHPARGPPRRDARAMPRAVLAAREAATRTAASPPSARSPVDARRRQRHPEPRHRLARRPRRRRRAPCAGAVADVSGDGRAVRRPDHRGVVDAVDRRSTPRSRAGSRHPARRHTASSAPAPGTTPASWPTPASRPRCCSSATPPASRTPRRSTPSCRLPRGRRGPDRRRSRTWPGRRA